MKSNVAKDAVIAAAINMMQIHLTTTRRRHNVYA